MPTRRPTRSASRNCGRSRPSGTSPGRVVHTVGWPLDNRTYGGSFLYHLEDNQVAVGFVIGLDYDNPYLTPFEEFQRFKTHPAIRATFEGGRRIAYGARALNEGGFQSIPRLDFPGGALIGCAAGFVNVPKIKGSHTAMKSGMVAAEAVFARLDGDERRQRVARALEAKLGLGRALPGAQHPPELPLGLWAGLAYSALDTYVLRGRAPWTFHHHADYAQLTPRRRGAADRLSQARRQDQLRPAVLGVHLEHQPRGEPAAASETARSGEGDLDQLSPLRLARTALLSGRRLRDRRRCGTGGKRLQINAQNCVHCKTCDIKDPEQNIDWVVPEGGGGPNYPNM